MKCPFCFNSGGGLRFDRKGKPYFCCDCGVRVFLRNKGHVLAMLSLSELANSLSSEEFQSLKSRVAMSSLVIENEKLQSYVEDYVNV